MKVLDATDIPAGCRIRHRTVAYERISILASGGLDWQDMSPGGNPDQPRADPPEGGPDNVAPGTTAFSDFPGIWFLPSEAVCTYKVRNSLFRTWVLLTCQGKTTVLGYWEWSFRQILHQGEDGIEFVATPAGPGPGSGPDAVPAPPGGWPEQGSGPTSWVPAESATAEATNDYNRVFPRP